MTSTTTPEQPSEPKFYKVYTLIMVSVFLLILLSLSAFFVHRLDQQVQNEIKSIEFYVDENGQQLDYLFRSAIDQLEITELDLKLKKLEQPDCTEASYAASVQSLFNDTASGFELKVAAQGSNQDPWLGRLVGAGSIQGRSAPFYCDLQASLLLRQNLASLPNTVSGANNAYFISRHDFYLLAPWQTGHVQISPTELKPHLADYFAALQANQQGSGAAPSSAIHDLFDDSVGSVVPVSMPLYDGNRFMGALSIGLSIEFIDRMNEMHHYPIGQSMIIDQKGQQLLQPDIDLQPKAMSDTYTDASAQGSSLFTSIDLLAQMPHAKAARLDGDIVIVYRLKSVPWSLVFTIPENEVHAKIRHDFGPGMLGVLLGLAVLMLTSYLVTSRYFVRPASKLVSHVAQESNFKPQPIPDVPKTWRPWFEVITKTFRESLEYTTLQREIDIAAKLQLSLLPSTFPKDSRFEIWGRMKPAKYVGGDFYDHLELDNGDRALVVADVSGKGIPAGLFGMVSKTYLRSLAMYGLVPVHEIMRRVNNRLCEDNDTCMFVTVFYGQYSPDTGVVTMSNAGHPPQLLISANGEVRWIKPEINHPALGVLENADYDQTTLQLEPGDQLLMFSDGVSEAMNTSQEEFGYERLAQLLANQPTVSAQATVQRVFEAIAAHEAGTEQSDDITCMVLHRLA